MMRNVLAVIIAVLVLGAVAYVFTTRQQAPAGTDSAARPTSTSDVLITMKLTSSAFKNNELMPEKYGCKGEGVNPPLAISGIPEGTKSLVLVVDDPDAPGGQFIHWLLWNIAPATTEIAEATVPEGSSEGVNSYGTSGYGAPCPPSGSHRYIFKLFALDTLMQLPTTARSGDVISEMQGHILEKTELTGLYSK